MITKLAVIEARRERFEEAVARIERGRKKVGDSAAAGLISLRRGRAGRWSRAEQAVLRLGRGAIDRAGSIEEHPPEIAGRLWGIRGAALGRRGETGRAIESAERVRRLVPRPRRAGGRGPYVRTVRESRDEREPCGSWSGKDKGTLYAEKSHRGTAAQPSGCSRGG